MSGKKNGRFDKDGIEGLTKDKPVDYEIQDKKGDPPYVGVAKRGRVGDRLKEHLPSGPDPIRGGSKVKIKQKSNIASAEKEESRAIKRKHPPKNKKGK